MSGDVFEANCDIFFSTRIEFDFVPMVCNGGQPTVREKRTVQWFSSHTEFSRSVQSQALEVFRVSSLASGASLDSDVYPSRVVDYNNEKHHTSLRGLPTFDAEFGSPVQPFASAYLQLKHFIYTYDSMSFTDFGYILSIILYRHQ